MKKMIKLHVRPGSDPRPTHYARSPHKMVLNHYYPFNLPMLHDELKRLIMV